MKILVIKNCLVCYLSEITRNRKVGWDCASSVWDEPRKITNKAFIETCPIPDWCPIGTDLKDFPEEIREWFKEDKL